MTDAVLGEELRAYAVPLGGMVAVEASAGTGKTYAITRLYLRLVVEARLPVREILVVTYTKAATAELRGRLRGALANASRALRTGRADDDVTSELLAHVADRSAARASVERALHGFDEAAVFTIHGFCQRVLTDRAFESGVLFDTELVPDQRDLVQEVVDDFWRRELYDTSPLFARFAVDQARLAPDGLATLVRTHAARPYRRIDAPAEVDAARCEDELAAALADVRARWSEDRAVVESLLTTTPALSRARYRVAKLPEWFRGLDVALAEEPVDLDPEVFARFGSARLAAATRQGQRLPAHPFFAACETLARTIERLHDAYAARVATLQARLVGEAGPELARRKRARRVQYYDDLVQGLGRALADPVHGPPLAAALRARYRAALIDEFQDTDSVQYDIVRRIYGDGTAPVFLVGDPKQAIYSFRGADVFTYLRARSDAATSRHLARNWRSVPALARAVNAVFGGAARPFVLDAIPFVPAVPADQTLPALVIADDPDAPLRVWLLPSEKRLTKDEARVAAADAAAREVARLLALGAAGGARLGTEPLHGGHIAILVRRNEDGRMMRERLLALGVLSVQQAVDSVFGSREALELERVLLAITSPGQGPLLRAALATELLGASGADVLGLDEDERAWEARVDAFHDYHDVWRTRGFAAMLRELLRREDVPRRLLAHDDGERRLTNVLHVGELLQGRETRAGGGMDALVEWLADARRAADVDEDEQQLRLESDERLVKIVTVHKSKGLEYPIVLCPFLWDGRLVSENGEVLVFHEDDGDARATLDLGSPARDARRPLAVREELAEHVRLLYVALTRAAHRCYVAWGDVNGGQSSPLAWLLHAPADVSTAADPIKAVAQRYGTLGRGGIRSDLERLVERAGGAVRVEPPPAHVARRPSARSTGSPPPGDARRLARPIPPAWQIASFTTLARGLDAERPDYDALTAAPAQPSPASRRYDVFGFPSGARAGSCVHGILERIDFAAGDPDAWTRVVRDRLRAYGFEPAWAPVLIETLARVVATPLDDASGLRLDRIAREARVNELEFHHPLARIEGGTLARLALAHGFGAGPIRDAVAQASVRPVAGFMKGFIDCIAAYDGRYWLFDYKTNWLGDAVDDYAADRLTAVMARDAYWLQYLVYTVVLHRWLARRLPDYDYDRHVGGVRYLFVRGMEPERGTTTGVYQDRPPRALIESLDAYMAGKAIA